MIEFIIPQNLPIRAVVATEPTAPPPEWLMAEMRRWANRQQQSLPDAKTFAGDQNPTIPSTQAMRTQVEQELELLRAQQALFANAAEELRRATKQVESQLNGLVQEFQEATVELAHAVSAKLLFEEIDQNRFPIENLIHEVVDRLETTVDAVVRLHPEDLEQVRSLPVIEGPDDEHSIRFVPDSSLSRGDCKAKAGEISVIYEVRRQVEEIRRQLLSTVNGHAET